ncbi:formate/nitrite transporter [Kineococcus radiotolerans]|uniref:Formate/nitrite transporter n=1 Tax=Kineococcus radiotolerans TaxID=131568 RepID=A0A7W4XW24_KINRA|nr:formate/nitrite transporter family protein [Kineococcus radiotolerans]MBB2899700.1 formate/nitrite transporter [Kineococcus radiotolerans]
MAYKTPDQIAVAAVASGIKKAHLPIPKMLVGGFLAGAYIAFAGLLAVDVTAGLDPAIWGGVTTLLTGAVFSMGLVLVIVAGSELLTGNMALVPIALLSRKVSLGLLARNWAFVLLGNLVGALFVAYLLAVQTGVIGPEGSPSFTRLAAIATTKAVTEDDATIFLRAIGCNWLVCLGVWMALAAEDVAGKVLAIFFPITAFVALGFDHVVANMFFLPAAQWAGVPGIGWGNIVGNWVFAALGNAVGGGVFVALAYWFLYLKGTEHSGRDTTPAAAPAASDGAGTAGAPRH